MRGLQIYGPQISTSACSPLHPSTGPVPHTHPQLVLGLTRGLVGQGAGRGSLETKLEAPLCLPGLTWRAVVKSLILYWEWRVGWDIRGLLENVFKTIKLWTFACGNLS